MRRRPDLLGGNGRRRTPRAMPGTAQTRSIVLPLAGVHPVLIGRDEERRPPVRLRLLSPSRRSFDRRCDHGNIYCSRGCGDRARAARAAPCRAALRRSRARGGHRRGWSLARRELHRAGRLCGRWGLDRDGGRLHARRGRRSRGRCLALRPPSAALKVWARSAGVSRLSTLLMRGFQLGEGGGRTWRSGAPISFGPTCQARARGVAEAIPARLRTTSMRLPALDALLSVEPIVLLAAGPADRPVVHGTRTAKSARVCSARRFHARTAGAAHLGRCQDNLGVHGHDGGAGKHGAGGQGALLRRVRSGLNGAACRHRGAPGARVRRGHGYSPACSDCARPVRRRPTFQAAPVLARRGRPVRASPRRSATRCDHWIAGLAADAEMRGRPLGRSWTSSAVPSVPSARSRLSSASCSSRTRAANWSVVHGHEASKGAPAARSGPRPRRAKSLAAEP